MSGLGLLLSVVCFFSFLSLGFLSRLSFVFSVVGGVFVVQWLGFFPASFFCVAVACVCGPVLWGFFCPWVVSLRFCCSLCVCVCVCVVWWLGAFARPARLFRFCCSGRCLWLSAARFALRFGISFLLWAGALIWRFGFLPAPVLHLLLAVMSGACSLCARVRVCIYAGHQNLAGRNSITLAEWFLRSAGGVCAP